MKTTIVLPVYNEEAQLESSISKLVSFLGKNKKDYQIVIADNASIDNTEKIGLQLEKKYPLLLKYRRIPVKGKGIALRTVWKEAQTPFLCFMDIDLSTDINSLPKLVDGLKNGYDIVIGSRHMSESKIKRSLFREILSRGYNFIIKSLFNTKINDMQCGFKGCSRDTFLQLEPFILDNEWFFDTELLMVGEKKGFKILEVPVKWTEDPNSKVKLINTVKNFLIKSYKLRKRLEKI
ncbi:MAG: dolichyl-phosphate beta-glucosyltransferase [archaeon]